MSSPLFPVPSTIPLFFSSTPAKLHQYAPPSSSSNRCPKPINYAKKQPPKARSFQNSLSLSHTHNQAPPAPSNGSICTELYHFCSTSTITGQMPAHALVALHQPLPPCVSFGIFSFLHRLAPPSCTMLMRVHTNRKDSMLYFMAFFCFPRPAVRPRKPETVSTWHTSLAVCGNVRDSIRLAVAF